MKVVLQTASTEERVYLSVLFSCIFHKVFQRGFEELHQAAQTCLYLVQLEDYGDHDPLHCIYSLVILIIHFIESQLAEVFKLIRLYGISILEVFTNFYSPMNPFRICLYLARSICKSLWT